MSFAVPGGNGSEPAKFANLKALSNLDVIGESDDALPEEDFPPFDVPASLEPDFWKVQKEQIKREQYDPTACFGKLSFSTAWTASLGLKIRAAMQAGHGWAWYVVDVCRAYMSLPQFRSLFSCFRLICRKGRQYIETTYDFLCTFYQVQQVK